MSDLARLLQQYGYGQQPNALANNGESYDTSNVLAEMPKPNALANALRVAGVPSKDEHGFLFSNVGGQLKFNPWEAVKNFMSYQAPPGALSTSGDDAPVRSAADVTGWLGLNGLGLNATGQVPRNALGALGGRSAPPKGLASTVEGPRASTMALDDRLKGLTDSQLSDVAFKIRAAFPDGANSDMMRRYIHQEVLRQVHAATKALSARTSAPVFGMGREQAPGEFAATSSNARAQAEAAVNAAIDEILSRTQK